METQTVTDTLSIDIQTQCWSAKAHYLVEELSKVDGIFPVTKEQIKLGLQGKVDSGVVQTDFTPNSSTKVSKLLGQKISENTNPVNILSKKHQESKRVTNYTFTHYYIN